MLDSGAAWYLIRQLVSAMAAFHRLAPHAAHGAIAPERIVIKPDARLVIVEHVMGSALERVRFSHERYWKELRIACPHSAGPPRFDQRTDVLQVGTVALSLILGRALRDDEYPSAIEDVVASAWDASAARDREPVPAGFQSWLARSLQFDPRISFPSAVEASSEFDRVLGESGYILAPAELERFLARCGESTTPPARAVDTERAKSEAAEVPAPNPILLYESIAPKSELERGDAQPVQSVAIVNDGEEEEDGADEDITSISWRVGNWRRAVVAAVFLTAVAGVGVRRHFVVPAAHASTDATVVDQGASTIPPSVELQAGLPAFGQLEVHTEPTGARVTVDGRARGVSPTMVADLSPGQHSVLLEHDLASTKQTVTVESGATASLVVRLTEPENTPSLGWVAVSAPHEVQLYEGGQLVGTSQDPRIEMTTGPHQIDFVNEAVGYRSSRVVQVVKGKGSSIKVEFPPGSIAVNAIPWAEVWIDGEKVGETPIGNVPISVGPHEIVFRNPDLGERREQTVVTLAAPVRLSVDLRKK